MSHPLELEEEQVELEEEEAVSGIGEGDDVMGEVEEGYSAYRPIIHSGLNCPAVLFGYWKNYWEPADMPGIYFQHHLLLHLPLRGLAGFAPCPDTNTSVKYRKILLRMTSTSLA